MATNSNMLSKSGTKGNKRRHFKTHWLSMSAIPRLRHSKRALLVVVLLASSAAALTSLGVWRAVRSAPGLAPVHSTPSGAIVAPATTNPPLTKLREYVYAGGRLIASEEKSCVSTLSPTSANSPQGGGPGSFNVSTSSGCSWSGEPGVSWITITGGLNGVGDGIVQYSVAPNSGPQRVGTITVNGQSFTITQAPSISSCIYSLSKTSDPLNSYQAGSGSVDLTVGAGCGWTAVSNATSWLTVTSPAGGSGSGLGTISYSFTANNSGEQRTCLIIIGGQNLNIIQPPNQASCSYSIDKNPPNYNATEQGGSNSFNLMMGVGCNWTAVSNASWLTVNSPASGIGNGSPQPISYTINPNDSGAQRTGSITTTGNKTLTVNQPPIQSSCTFSLSPSSASYPIEGGTGSFNISTGAGCQWYTVNNDGWIRIDSGSSGISNGQPAPVSFTVLANNGGPRIGYISVGNKAFTVNQRGVVTINPTGNQTPAYANSSAVTSATNTGHGLENAEASSSCCFGGPVSQDKSCQWFSFQPVSGQISKITLKFDWSAYGNISTNAPESGTGSASATALFQVSYSTDNGSNFTTAKEKYEYSSVFGQGSDNKNIDDFGSVSVNLPASTPINQIFVRDRIYSDAYAYGAGSENANSYIYGTISGIKLEVEVGPSTTQPASTDTNQHTGLLGSPESGGGQNGAWSQQNAIWRWMARPLGRAGLALLTACGVLAFLLRTRWRQARRQFATNVAGVMSRIRDQIASRLGELFRIAAETNGKLQFVGVFGKGLLVGTYDKLQFVTDFGKRLLAGTYDKLKFVGHFLATFSPIFKVVSCGGAVMRFGKQKLAVLLPESVRTIVRRALSLWRGMGLGRLKPVLRRALAIAMIVILATPLGPAQADGLARAAQATWRTMSAAANRHGASSDGGTFDRLIKALGKRPSKPVSAAAQAEQVTKLQVCPTQHVMFVGECYTFTPIALAGNDTDGWHVVHGAGMSWSKPEDNIAEVSSFGEVEAKEVGYTTVTVQSGSVYKQITIEVRIGTRPTGSNQQADLDTGDCAAEQASMFAPQSAARASAQQKSAAVAPAQRKSAAGAPAQQSLIGEDGVPYDWDPSSQLNSLAAQFRNAVGNPRFSATSQGGGGVPTSTQLGSDNYQFNVPVVSVGGRGVSASIGMTLNSRVWNTDNGKLTLNYVWAVPCPGWSMGFGKIIRNYNDTDTGDGSGIGSGNSPGDYLLVAGDGTRIRLAAKYDAAAGKWFHESDDGSFLKFNPTSGEMFYPDGTRMIYGAVNGCLLPTSMIGTNGGVIAMSYRDYCEGNCQQVFRHRTALNAVRDTRGRYVTFHYYGDAGNEYPADPDPTKGHPAGELAAIKAPDKDGVQQEVIRVEYQPITLRYDFDPGLDVVAPANNTQIQLVRRISYPQTGKGFLFLDYSSYGMPRKISSRMSMKGVGGITDGVEIAYTTYNYTTINQEDPSDSPYGRNQGAAHLSDFPQFTARKELWLDKTEADGTSTAAPTTYVYSHTTNGTTEETTMEYVGKNCKDVTTTGTDSGQPSFGKVISVERKKIEPGETLSKQVFTYMTMTGQDGEVEIKEVETFDEAGQGTLVGFGDSS